MSRFIETDNGEYICIDDVASITHVPPGYRVKYKQGGEIEISVSLYNFLISAIEQHSEVIRLVPID